MMNDPVFDTCEEFGRYLLAQNHDVENGADNITHFIDTHFRITDKEKVFMLKVIPAVCCPGITYGEIAVVTFALIRKITYARLHSTQSR
jgi:hypothetical protein